MLLASKNFEELQRCSYFVESNEWGIRYLNDPDVIAMRTMCKALSLQILSSTSVRLKTIRPLPKSYKIHFTYSTNYEPHCTVVPEAGQTSHV